MNELRRLGCKNLHILALQSPREKFSEIIAGHGAPCDRRFTGTPKPAPDALYKPLEPG